MLQTIPALLSPFEELKTVWRHLVNAMLKPCCCGFGPCVPTSPRPQPQPQPLVLSRTFHPACSSPSSPPPPHVRAVFCLASKAKQAEKQTP